eukprot:GFUD01020127.1.p1 GENE.GFUD01020127.1~~GFUD01020127.1.p1  ORF type:complete len:695 (-),score=171.77 GFUD01020127.1:207-2246(-)
MSSSWRDGLAFCALIHRFRPDLIDFDRLDQQDWTGNCSLAFQVAESQLGIPPLLDVEDVIKNESPDQFFIMTYVAQFYHKFTAPDSGYDSTLTTSFKYSSSEEDSPRKIDNTGKRKGGGHNLMEWKRRRPLGLVVSGGLELRIESPQEEKENPFKSDDCRNHENTLKTYDADDEEGESSEVVLRNIPGIMTEARNGTASHQDLVLKRKRPNSLNRVSNSSMDKENYCKSKEIKNKSEKRNSKRMLKPKAQESVNKRKMIGISDFPKPYENKDLSESESHKYLTERRRKKSAESVACSNLYNQTSIRLREKKDPLIERVKQVPLHIAESQKLLKTSIFQLKSPQYPTKCLILNIYKIKYERRASSPPAVKCQNLEKQTSRQSNDVGQSTMDNSLDHVQIQPNECFRNQPRLSETDCRVPSLSPSPTTHLQQYKVQEPTLTKPQRTMQTNDCNKQSPHTSTEHFRIQPQERTQTNKLEITPGHRITTTHKYEKQTHNTTLEHKQDITHQTRKQTDNVEPLRHTLTQNRKYEQLEAKKLESQTPERTFANFKSHIPTPSSKFELFETHEREFEKFNIQNPCASTKFEHISAQTSRHPSKYEHFKSHTLTPRSRSKYEHLIKNLKESQDDNLVIYKVLESTPCKPTTTPVTPYKEPKDKYTIEYLWNIGATNFQARRPPRKCH